MVRTAVAAAVSLLMACDSGRMESEPEPPVANLIAGLAPSGSSGVSGSSRLTDGILARAGDGWKTDLTAVLASSGAFVEYDLGRPRRLAAALVQADNNDIYILSVSADGEQFEPVWRAAPHPQPGMRIRSTARLAATGRWVRLSASGGDGSYSLSEVQLFGSVPARFPPRLPAEVGKPPDRSIQFGIGLLGAALMILLLLTYLGEPWWWALALVSLPLGAGLFLGVKAWGNWPIGSQQVSFLRAVVAAVTVTAIAREVFAPKLFAAQTRVVIGVMIVCATLAMAAFFNLGHPQFWNHRDNTPSAVHNHDMRVYYPVAKYFQELRFDGVYLASVAAYLDDDSAVSIETLGDARLRDLTHHRMVTVAEVSDQVLAMKERFTPERWQAFKRDMRYFRTTMGPEYLGSMRDHGGNATPFWLAIAHLVFAGTEANDTTLLATAALDPLLLVLMFVVIARTFGLRAMLVAMIIFGANDFYMFGSNWVGATLRHDWMAYLGLGICALKRERWVLGGILLGTAAMIRAFPAMALAALVFPWLWWLWQYRHQNGALPPRAETRARALPLLKIYGGAAGLVVAAFVFSGLVLSFSAWGEWLQKVMLLSRDPHVNHVSIRLLFDGLRNSHPVLRLSLVVAASGGGALALLLAMRNRQPAQAAVLGLCLVPAVLYPANYYAHFVFLIPLLAEVTPRDPIPGRIDAGIWLTVGMICVVQYGTVGAPSWGIHFGAAAMILIIGLAIVVSLLLRRDRIDAEWSATGRSLL